MTELAPPFERIYDLNRLSEAGYETRIAPGAADLAKLAEWTDVVAVTSFAGEVSLKRLSPSRFAYAAHLEAEILQNCTVTLEPVSSLISLDFTRTLQLVRQLKRTVDIGAELLPGSDETADEIDTTRFDLAAPVLEEFLLAVDPYPRAPGASFEAGPEAGKKPESPFAVLGKPKESP